MMRRPLGVNDVGKNDDTAKTVCFFVFSLRSSRQKSLKLLTIQKVSLPPGRQAPLRFAASYREPTRLPQSFQPKFPSPI